MHQIKQTQLGINKYQESTKNIIKEIKNTNIKSKLEILIEYTDIYKEYSHKYILSHQLINEVAQLNFILDKSIQVEKETPPPEPVPIPENPPPQNLQPKIRLQNFPKRSGSVNKTYVNQLHSAYICRRKFVSQEVKIVKQLESQNMMPPNPRSSLPSLKGNRIDTDPQMTLETLFGPENSRILKNYTKLIQRFNTTKPTKLHNMFDGIRRNNAQLERRLNLVQHECKKLKNKIEASTLQLKGEEEVYKAILSKINSMNSKFNINATGTPYMKALQLKDFCKELVKERRQKKMAESRNTKKKIKYSNLVKIQRTNQDKPKVNPESEVPAIALGPEISADYQPGTRITRRAYEDMKIKSYLNENDINMFGEALGWALTERFASTFVVFPHVHYKEDVFEITRPARLSLKPSELEIPKIILTNLTQIYKENSSNLHLLVFSEEEINSIASEFLVFISMRDQLMMHFERYFDEKLFSEFFNNLLTENQTAACYFARDFANKMYLKNSVPMLLGKLIPYFVKIDNQEQLLPFFAAFDSFLRISANPLFHNQISILVTEKTTKFVDELIDRPMTNFVRSALTIMLSFGVNFPEPFAQHSTLRSVAYSTAQNFIEQCKDYKTCIQTGVSFISTVLNNLDVESVQWHLCYFIHILIHELTKQVLRISIISCILEVITSIIANRSQLINEQLASLHFLDFVMKNIGLEELIDDKLGSHQGPRPIAQVFKKGTQMIFPLTKKLSQQDMNKMLPLLNLENPKPQIALNKAQKPYKKSESISMRDYNDLRESMPIYFDTEIHVKFIQLIFAFLIDHQIHNFDNVFVDPFPQVNRKPNVLFTLMRHMEMKQNEEITPMLKEAYSPEIPKLSLNFLKKTFSDKGGVAKNLSLNSAGNITLPSFISNSIDDDLLMNYSDHHFPTEDEEKNDKNISKIDEMEQFNNYLRLLRLLVPEMFNPEDYKNGQHIASGAFGAVMAVMVNDVKVAVKILQKSRDTFDNPKLVDVFGEISILELCKGDRRVTQLLNYGCTSDSYYIVMEFYPMTLKTWRKSFQSNPPLPTIIRLFKEFLNAATVLLDNRINHFDIKCDNVVLDKNGYPALADFGESICYKNEASSYTQLNRGTEWIKSPEMLSIAINASVNNPTFDRRKQVGAGPASDVWSIGCLFYELLTGEFLFVDTDWSRFFTRVTDPKEALITPQCMKKLPKDMRFSGFIEFVLQRSVSRRPSLTQVIAKFDEYFPDAMEGPLPHIEYNDKVENKINEEDSILDSIIEDEDIGEEEDSKSED